MLRAGGAPRTPALRTLKASAGQSGGPGGCRKAFPVPSAPAEEKYRRWGRGGRRGTHLPGIAAPGHSSLPLQAFREIFGLSATFSLHPKAANRAALIFFSFYFLRSVF